MTPSTPSRNASVLALFAGLATIFLLCTSAPAWARGGKPVATPAGAGDGTPFEEPEWAPSDDPVDEGGSGGGNEDDPKDGEDPGPDYDQGGGLQMQGGGISSQRLASPYWLQAGLFHLRMWSKH